MAVVLLCSGGGAPGTTTTALGLTLRWPRSAVLVDANREPDQGVLAGWLRGADPGGRGLASLAVAYRDRGSIDLLAHGLPLTDDGGRAFVPGFASPGAVGPFAALWPELGHTLRATSTAGWDVIVDAGRIGPTGLPLALVAAADVALVVTRSSLRALAGARLYAPGVGEQVAGTGHGTVGLVVVGPERPYASADIAAQFDLPVWAEVSLDAERAAVLSEGVASRRAFATSALMRSYATAATAIDARLEQARELVGTPTGEAA